MMQYRKDKHGHAISALGYGCMRFPTNGDGSINEEETERLLADKAYLESVYRAGAEKASYAAEKTLRKVYKKVGFIAR